MTCNFSCLIETKGLFKVTGSHVHGKSGNISETVQDNEVITICGLSNIGNYNDLE